MVCIAFAIESVHYNLFFSICREGALEWISHGYGVPLVFRTGKHDYCLQVLFKISSVSRVYRLFNLPILGPWNAYNTQQYKTSNTEKDSTHIHTCLFHFYQWLNINFFFLLFQIRDNCQQNSYSFRWIRRKSQLSNCSYSVGFTSSKKCQKLHRPGTSQEKTCSAFQFQTSI